MAAAIRAFIPPQAAAEVHVAQFVVLAAELLDAGVVLALGLELLELLELLQPAARTIVATVALSATIALVARKVALPCRPPGGGRTCHLG
ncbi:hypothetical protein [Trebonia sp.]|uniref:hypothetical protein n=1 Tax=Trebonia sp. TaxID=2767075 RepID=UPI00262164B5|nr:hypothetical protein [Trebonia sp.]